MSLPKSVAGTERVQLSGGWIDVRSLTVDEMETVVTLTKKDGRKGNMLAISLATDEPHDGVVVWYNDPSTIAGDVTTLLAAIGRVSGTDEGAQFPRRESDDASDARESI